MHSHGSFCLFLTLLFAAVLPLSPQAPITDHPTINPDSAILPKDTPLPPTVTPQATVTPPEFVPTPEDIGDALQAHQRYQASIAAYAKEPNRTAAIWNKMGIAYEMLFNLDEAIRCYNESLRLNPENPFVLNNLGTIYDMQKKYSAAERMYRKAIKADPQSALVQKNLGTNLMMQRRRDEGAKAYERAVQLDPDVFRNNDNPTVHNPTPVQDRGAINYFMARGCARMGKIDCALQYLRAAINEGYTTIEKVFKDAQFKHLRNDPAFKQMAAELQEPIPSGGH